MVRVLALTVVLAASAVSAADAAERRYRTLHRPPAVGQLANSVAIEEGEWFVRPSRTAVAAGDVKIGVYNRGMDDHDLTIADPNGAVVGQLALVTGTRDSVTLPLGPGRYKLYCSLFAGTPISHETVYGMVSFIDVR